jgi:hypothetical protein
MSQEPVPSQQTAIGNYIAQADRGGVATVNVFQGPTYFDNVRLDEGSALAMMEFLWYQ